MKKKLFAAILISGLALSTVASAKWGNGGGYGYNCGNCPQMQYMQPGVTQLDPAVKAKLDAFFTDTQDLRKQMAVKQSERRALMQSANPDAAAIGKITGEIFDLRTTMRTKAAEAGVEEYLGPRGMGGRGMGGKRGFHHGQRGQGRMGGGMMMQYNNQGY